MEEEKEGSSWPRDGHREQKAEYYAPVLTLRKRARFPSVFLRVCLRIFIHVYEKEVATSCAQGEHTPLVLFVKCACVI